MISLPGNTHQIAMALANTISLTTEQKALISTELAKSKYTGLTTKQKLAKLHDPTHDSVTVRQDATWPATRKFLAKYQYDMLVGRNDLSSAIKQKWQIKIPVIMAAYTDEFTYNARTSAMFEAIAVDGLADGVVTEAEVEAFRASFEHSVSKSPVEILLGEEVVLELSDLEAL